MKLEFGRPFSFPLIFFVFFNNVKATQLTNGFYSWSLAKKENLFYNPTDFRVSFRVSLTVFKHLV